MYIFRLCGRNHVLPLHFLTGVAAAKLAFLIEIRSAHTHERITTMRFVDMIIGNWNANILGAQGITFNASTPHLTATRFPLVPRRAVVVWPVVDHLNVCVFLLVTL